MQDRDREGQGLSGSKKSKLIPVLPRGVGLKSYLIPASPPLQGGKNPRERSGEG